MTEILGHVASTYVESAEEPGPGTGMEEVQPHETPEQLFAAHVAAVAANGDSLDAISKFNYPYSRLAGKGLTMAAAAELATMTEGRLATMGAIAIVGLAKMAYGRRSKDRAFRESEHRMAEDVQEAVGERYELYRVRDGKNGDHEVVMRWYGPEDAEKNNGLSKPTSSHLETVAKLAADNDIKAIFIAPEVLSEDADAASRYAGDTVRVKKWLDNKKSQIIGFGPKRGPEPQTHVYAPDQLMALAREFGKAPREIPQLESLMELLRSRRPEHPLITIFEMYRADGALATEKVQKSARAGLEYQLGDVTAVPIRRPLPGQAKSAKLHLDAVIAGSDVMHYPSGQKVGHSIDKNDLLRTLGLDEARLQDILAHPDRHPVRDVVTAIEYAASQLTPLPTPESDQTADEKPERDNAFLLQDVIRQNIRRTGRVRLYPEGNTVETTLNGRFRKIMRNGIAAIVLAAASVSVTGEHHQATTQQNAAYDAEEARLAHQLGLSSTGDLDATEIEYAIKHYLDPHPYLRTYLGVHDGLENLLAGINHRIHGDEIGPEITVSNGVPIPAYGSPSGLSGGTTSIGNVADGPSTPEWLLEPHGGMSTKGYWATDVGSEYNISGEWIDMGFTYAPHMLPTDVSPAKYPKSISVTLNPKIPLGQKSDYIEVPVLEGTRPVAATIGGAVIEEKRTINNSFMLHISEQDRQAASRGATLRYWLAPDPGTAPFAHTSQYFTSGMKERERGEIAGAWNSVLANPHVSGEARAQEEAEYIRDNFAYDLHPMTDEQQAEMKNGQLSYPDFVINGLDAKKAVCNTAQTLVLLDNPELNAAWGYRNNDDNVLFSKEAHMWMVDRAGKTLDATPWRTSAVEQSNASDSTDASLLGGLVLGGLMLAGATGYGFRRQLRIAYHASRLNRYSVQELDRAMQLADMASYAEGGVVDPAKVLPLHERQSASTVLENLTKPHRHSAAARDDLETAAIVSPSRATRAELRKARRILTSVRKLGLVRPQRPATDLSGLLQ